VDDGSVAGQRRGRSRGDEAGETLQRLKTLSSKENQHRKVIMPETRTHKTKLRFAKYTYIQL
jgi:hypothetical protein